MKEGNDLRLKASNLSERERDGIVRACGGQTIIEEGWKAIVVKGRP